MSAQIFVKIAPPVSIWEALAEISWDQRVWVCVWSWFLETDDLIQKAENFFIYYCLTRPPKVPKKI